MISLFLLVSEPTLFFMAVSMVQQSEFVATDPEVFSSIPGSTRFSEK
jgi:hypothetical protein